MRDPAVPTKREYARLCLRGAVAHARDAVVLANAGRAVACLVSCQHGWEMVAKAAMACQAPSIPWPPPAPPQRHWMNSHRVLDNLQENCPGVDIEGPTRAALFRLEQWLPPGPGEKFPSVNTEYLFFSASRWQLPEDYFQALHAETALAALSHVIELVASAYRAEFDDVDRRLPARARAGSPPQIS